MAIILDADVIIRGERGAFDLLRWLESRGDEQFEVAAITVAELWHEVERATAAQKNVRENYLRALLDVLPIIPYTDQTAYHHAKLWAQLESSGKMIGPYDLIVAATALDRGSTLATFNKKHFANVAGLKLVEPK
ncbi:MAG TPA: PIN domain-containing protein [Terriglobales bacterium]|jgi:predicted nucleic acid-binding protein